MGKRGRGEAGRKQGTEAATAALGCCLWDAHLRRSAFIRNAILTNYLDISNTSSSLCSPSSPFFLPHFGNAFASWLLFLYVFFPYKTEQPAADFLPFYLQLGGARRAGELESWRAGEPFPLALLSV